MLITVFTPTYNRAHLLPRVYESLCQQTFRDFEWVIVDDGSSDETISVVRRWTNDSSPKGEDGRGLFPIRYIYQQNGGKHRAINRGVREARGDLFFIVDSDDYILEKSLERIWDAYLPIRGDNSFGGVAGLLMHSDGTIIGNMPAKSPTDCTQVDYWCKYHIKGDKTEVFRTEVLKKIPFPEYDGEKFCPEELEWLRISQRYKLRYINEVLGVRDYIEGGLTSKIVKIRMDSPRATIEDYFLYNTFNIPLKKKVKNSINYWRFRFCLPVDYKEKYIIPTLRWYWNWVMPIGWLMHQNDMKNVKQL